MAEKEDPEWSAEEALRWLILKIEAAAYELTGSNCKDVANDLDEIIHLAKLAKAQRERGLS